MRNEGIPLFKGKNVQDGEIVYDFEAYIPETLSNELQRSQITKKCLLTPYVGTIGNIGLHNKEGKFHLGSNVGKIEILNPSEDNVLMEEYVHYYMLSCYGYAELTKYKKATAQESISIDAIRECYIAIPPYNEQRRIVQLLDIVKPTIFYFEKVYKKKERLSKEVFVNLKKSILQEAIRGKLVPQDPSDEPASVLLEKIRAEKERLFKEGVLKKKDLVSSIIYRGDDNKYYEQIGKTCQQIEVDYDFPDNWKIVRLANICRLIDGEKREGNYVCLDAKFLRGKSTGMLLSKGKLVKTGDNIILVDGENSGEVFTVPCDGYMGSTFKQLWVCKTMFLPYVLYFIQFYKDLLRNSKKGAAIPHLNKEIFYSLVIGIPPYQEQVRIAKRVELLTDKIRG